MIPDLSILYAFRNREPIRIRRCFESLARQTHQNFEVIFVDTGSGRSLAAKVKKLVESFEFAKYIYTDTRGMYWNKSEAINIAAKQAKASLVLSADIDMIYEPNFVEVMLSKADQDSMVNAYHHFLPKKFEDWGNESKYKNELEYSGILYTGPGLMCPTNVFLDIHGYDEYYRLWGAEDDDLVERLVDYGLKRKHISPDETGMYHQWHPAGIWKRKLDYEFAHGHYSRKRLYLLKNKSEVKRNLDGFGKIRSKEDRVVFHYIDPESGKVKNNDAEVFNLPTNKASSDSKFIGQFLKKNVDEVAVLKDYQKSMASGISQRLLNYAHRFGLMKGIGSGYPLLKISIDHLIMEYREVLEDYYLDDHHFVAVRSDKYQSGYETYPPKIE